MLRLLSIHVRAAETLETLERKYSELLVGASCRLSNKEWSLLESFQVKMARGSIKGKQTMFPLASPQVVQTGKHSLEVRTA